MTKDEELRMINEKLDFYVMEASDEEFDTEEVRKLVKRLDELDPIPLPWKSDEMDNKNYIQLRNNVLVWLTEKRKAHEVKGEEMYNR